MCTREGGLWECGWDNRAGERGTGGIDANGLCNGNGIGLICGEGGEEKEGEWVSFFGQEVC